MMLYIAWSGRTFDERAFATLLRLSRKLPPSIRVDGGGRFKGIVREQFLALFFDEARAVRTLPALLPDDRTQRAGALELIRDAVGAVGGLPLATVTERLWMVEAPCLYLYVIIEYSSGFGMHVLARVLENRLLCLKSPENVLMASLTRFRPLNIFWNVHEAAKLGRQCADRQTASPYLP